MGKLTNALKTEACNVMAGSTSRIDRVLTDFLTPNITNIFREPTRESLNDINCILRSNAASISSNLGGGHHDHLALTMAAGEYLSQTRHMFIPPHNPGN